MGRLQHGVGPQYNTTSVHEYEGLDSERLAYIALDPVAAHLGHFNIDDRHALTTAGDSTPRRLLAILSHEIQFSIIKRNEKRIEQEQVYLLPHPTIVLRAPPRGAHSGPRGSPFRPGTWPVLTTEEVRC